MSGSTKFWLAVVWGVRLWMIYYSLFTKTNSPEEVEILTFIFFVAVIVVELVVSAVMSLTLDDEVENNAKYFSFFAAIWYLIKLFNKFLNKII